MQFTTGNKDVGISAKWDWNLMKSYKCLGSLKTPEIQLEIAIKAEKPCFRRPTYEKYNV